MNDIPRRRLVATYGRSQRKRKSNELFAELDEEFSPRRPAPRSISSSPDPEAAPRAQTARSVGTKSPDRKAARIDDVELGNEGFLFEESGGTKKKKPAKGVRKTGEARKPADTFDFPSSSDEKPKRRKPNTSTNGTAREPVTKSAMAPKKRPEPADSDPFDIPSSDEETPRHRKPIAVKKTAKLLGSVSRLAPHPTETHDFRKKTMSTAVVQKDVVSEKVVVAKTTSKAQVPSKTSTVQATQTNGVGKITGSRSRSTTPALRLKPAITAGPAVSTRQTRSRSNTPALMETDAQDDDPTPRPKAKLISLETTKKSAAALAREVALKPKQAIAIVSKPRIVMDKVTSKLAPKRITDTKLESKSKRRSASPEAARVPKSKPMTYGNASSVFKAKELKQSEPQDENVDAMDFDTADDDLVNYSMMVTDDGDLAVVASDYASASSATNTSIPRKGRHRTRDKSAPPVTHMNSLNDMLDEIKPISPPKRRRLIDSLAVDANYVPKTHASDDEEEVPDEELTIYQDETEQALVEIADSQDSQGDSQGYSQPRDHLLPARGGPRNTYLRQRSYLTEELTPEDAFKQPLLIVPPTVRKAKPAFDEGLEDDGPKKGGLKSKHELREAGGSKRFLDDMEGYMEDVESPELRTRRMGFMDLSNKIGNETAKEKTFVRMFRANNLDQRYLADMNSHDDEIIRFCIGYSLCIFLAEDTTGRTVTQIRHDGAIPMLLEMINSDRDIVKVSRDKELNFSKIVQGMVVDLRKRVAASLCFKDHKLTVLSGQLVALQVIEQILQVVKQAGFEDDIVTNFDANMFVELMEPFMKTTEAPGEEDLLHLQLPLSILEVLSTQDNSANIRIKQANLRSLAIFLPRTLRWIGDESEERGEQIRALQFIVLRVIINLTNLSDGVSEMLATNGANAMSVLVQTIIDKFYLLAAPGNMGWDDVQLEQRDLLILTLGLLMNIVEQCDATRAALLSERLGNVSALEALVQLYIRKSNDAANAESAEEAETNVAFGYLAVAIAHICQNGGCRNVVKGMLKGGGLKVLCASLEEFIGHHRKIEGDMSYDVETDLTGRLEKAAEELRMLI